MSLALELPDEYESGLESGEKTVTFQVRDKIVIGDIVTIMAGNTKRKARIINKVWVPEVEMSDEVRQEFRGKVPKEVGFSGAFKISLQYADDTAREPGATEGEEGEEKIDVISRHMD